MSWGARDWVLGRVKLIPPVYGSGIPLSTFKANVWMQICPHCGGPLKKPSSVYPGPVSEHRAVDPGDETMWLAKLYADALLMAWHAVGAEEGLIEPFMPTIACAARAAYTDAGERHTVYYIAGPTKSKALHKLLPLKNTGTSILTVDDFETKIVVYLRSLLSPGLRRPKIDVSARVIFSQDVLDWWSGPKGVARKLFPPPVASCWIDAAEDIEKRKLNATYYKPNLDADTDKDFHLFSCTEQRVVLCHRWVNLSANSEVRTKLGFPSDVKLDLEEMTVAMVDLHPDKDDPFAIWWREFDKGAGFPVPPCNTCRIVLPALLCEGSASLPTGTPIVIPEPTSGERR